MSNIERALRRAQQDTSEQVPVPAGDEKPGPDTVVAGIWALSRNIVAYHDRYSPGAESFRKLAAKLLALRRQRGERCLMVGVTSAMHAEGKSITAANLAVVLAQDFRVPTLLVDCDIRRPTFRKYLGVDLGAGFADLVRGVSPEDTIVGTPLQDLQLLGSGTPDNPSQVFEAGRVGTVVEALRRYADLVICDCPPVLPVADTQMLAPHLDGMLIIVRAGTSQATDIRRTLSVLQDANILGFVLNYADMESPTYYHADDSYYFHSDEPD